MLGMLDSNSKKTFSLLAFSITKQPSPICHSVAVILLTRSKHLTHLLAEGGSLSFRLRNTHVYRHKCKIPTYLSSRLNL